MSKKIPTEVDVVPRYKLLKLFILLKLFNLFTLFTLFTLFSKQCLHDTYVICIVIWIERHGTSILLAMLTQCWHILLYGWSSTMIIWLNCLLASEQKTGWSGEVDWMDTRAPAVPISQKLLLQYISQNAYSCSSTSRAPIQWKLSGKVCKMFQTRLER